MNTKELTDMLVESGEDFHQSKFIPWWTEDYEKFTYRYHMMEPDVIQEAKACIAECTREDLLSSAGKLGLTLFHLLVWHNFYDDVEKMLEDGRIGNADVDVPDQKGHGLTPFLLACARGNLNMVRLLLTHGAKDSSCDAREMNAYHFLVYPRFEELDNDSDLLERSVEQRAEIARLLTCDINQKNSIGLTPLEHMLSMGQCDRYTWPLAEIFLEKGASTSYRDPEGNTLLMMARRNGHDTAALQLMKHCPEMLDAANNNGVTPVLHAIDYRNHGMYIALVDHGATPAPNEELSDFPLSQIVCNAFGNVYPDNKDSLSLAMYLAEKLIRQTDPDDDDEIGEVKSILSHAFRSDEKARILDLCKDAGLDFTMPVYYCGDVICLRDECLHVTYGLTPIKKLAELGVDMDNAVVQGRTPANILAADYNHNTPEDERFFQEAAKIFSAESMETANNYGEAAIHLASQNGHAPMLQVMIEKGINVNLTEDAPAEAGTTPLHLACLKAQTEVVRLLMTAGADDTMTIRKGSTPAHLVLMKDSWGKSLSTEQMAELLKELKSLDLPNEEGVTPLMMLRHSTSELLPIFMDKGVDVNHADNYGRTALMLCMDKDMYKALLQAGADINMVDNDGNSALHHALLHGAQGEARYLIRKGADYNRPNNKGETPAQLAAEKGCETVLDLMTNIK